MRMGCTWSISQARRIPLVAQTVKRLPTMRETRFQSLGGEDACRRKWQPTPVFLPGKSQGRRRLVGYSPWGCKESNTTEQLHFLSLWSISKHFFILSVLPGTFCTTVAKKKWKYLEIFSKILTFSHAWPVSLIDKSGILWPVQDWMRCYRNWHKKTRCNNSACVFSLVF